MILKGRPTTPQKIRLTNSSRNWRNKINHNVQSITRKNVIRAALNRLGQWLTKADVIDVVVAVVRIATIVVILAMLSSCGASWHLKRAIEKDPTIAGDTIVRVDTTIVTNERRITDTLVVNDTIVREIKSNGVRASIQRIHDTIRVDVVCPPDTIRVAMEVPVDRIIYKEKPPKRSILDRIEMMLFMVVLIAIALMVRQFLMGRRN